MGRDAQNQRIDMIGFKSGLLTVVGPDVGPNPKRAYWLCQCACGGQHTVMGKYLRSGEVKSCGCLNRTSLIPRIKHGMAPAKGKKPRAYSSWASMKDRCLNPNNPKWLRYGGRGIKVCKEWMEFVNFYADMGDPPVGMTLDRVDNSKGYSADNCRWATVAQQASNTRQNRWLEFQGKRMTLSQWAREFSMPVPTLHQTIARLGADATFAQLTSKL